METIMVKWDGKSIPVSLFNMDYSVGDLKNLVHYLTQVFPYAQKLIFKGKLLEDSMKLGESGMRNSDTIMMIAGLQENFQATDLDNIAIYYHIIPKTVYMYYNHMEPILGNVELCCLLSLSEEFKSVKVAEHEKKELAQLLGRVSIQVKESLDMSSAKINVLVQAYISRIKIEEPSLSLDMAHITQSAGQLMRALFVISLKQGWGHLSEKALNLCKMFTKRMWSDQTPFRQFGGIADEILIKLDKGKFGLDEYCDLTLQKIDELICNTEMARTLHKLINQIPKLNVEAHVESTTHTVLTLKVEISTKFEWDDKLHRDSEPFWIIVKDNHGEYILHHEYFLLRRQYIDKVHIVNIKLPINDFETRYFIHVVSDKWIASPTIVPVSWEGPPEKCPPERELLLDLQPLSVTELMNPAYEALYQDINHFNSLQSQVFDVLYNTDDNVLVAALGIRNTLCAEFAVLRNHQKEPDGGIRVVYIAPLESIAKECCVEWGIKFGFGLGLRVVELTGEIELDEKLIKNGDIIISTPEKWDALSLCWRENTSIQQVRLFIVDELHLIGCQGGDILEVVVSRMRYIASQVENVIRIVALSSSVANAKDLGEWIGATSNRIFDFPSDFQSYTPEIDIQEVDFANFEARMTSMRKLTYTALVQHAKNRKPTIIFVATRKHIHLMVVDLLTYPNKYKNDKQAFHLGFPEEANPLINNVEDETLRETLHQQVGYLHEGLSRSDQEVVRLLFDAGSIQVCVMSSSMCWVVPLAAHLVVVMGTEYYDNWSERSHREYPITDLLQMMGHARRPLLDDSGKFVVLCHAPHKEYYTKFLNEDFLVESRLHHHLDDHINAEVAAGAVVTKQHAINCLTWTFMYKRLTQNPRYYNLQGVSCSDITGHLLELVEDTLARLVSKEFVAIGDDAVELSFQNLGLIAYSSYISCRTIERFSSIIYETDLGPVIEILATDIEYEKVPVRPDEEGILRGLIKFPFVKNPGFKHPLVKASALLQAHISRQPVEGDLVLDQREILLLAKRLVPAMVMSVACQGLLAPAVMAIYVSQMLKQGLWQWDSTLLQIPHFTKYLDEHCKAQGIATVYDLMQMEDDKRCEVLKMDASQFMDVKNFFKRYPYIEVFHDIDEVIAAKVIVKVDLVRSNEKATKEDWWVLAYERNSDRLLDFKCVTLKKKLSVNLELPVSDTGEKLSFCVYCMCSSYLGCDVFSESE